MPLSLSFFFFFFFNDTAPTEIYPLSLPDALPIYRIELAIEVPEPAQQRLTLRPAPARLGDLLARSEEHTSELQSQSNLVCRLLLEKKKKKQKSLTNTVHQPTYVQQLQHHNMSDHD